jgi:hypothetical protein
MNLGLLFAMQIIALQLLNIAKDCFIFPAFLALKEGHLFVDYEATVLLTGQLHFDFELISCFFSNKVKL